MFAMFQGKLYLAWEASPLVRLQDDIKRYEEIAPRVLPYVTDTVDYIHQAVDSGKRILVEVSGNMCFGA